MNGHADCSGVGQHALHNVLHWRQRLLKGSWTSTEMFMVVIRSYTFITFYSYKANISYPRFYASLYPSYIPCPLPLYLF